MNGRCVSGADPELMHAQLALTGGVYDEDVLTGTADRIDVSFEAVGVVVPYAAVPYRAGHFGRAGALAAGLGSRHSAVAAGS